MPQHVQFIEKLLAAQQVNYFEKNIASQLVEFMSYYTSEMLNQAQINRHYRDREGESKLPASDLRLAIKLKQQNCFSGPISSSFVQQVAKDKNSIPLS